MSKCIICGKEVDKTYGNSNLMGVYCRSCATENHYTNEQLIEDLQKQLAITEKALELAVKDKCKFENALLSTSLGIAGGKVAVPKKEQYYIEQAKEMLGNEQ